MIKSEFFLKLKNNLKNSHEKKKNLNIKTKITKKYFKSFNNLNEIIDFPKSLNNTHETLENHQINNFDKTKLTLNSLINNERQSKFNKFWVNNNINLLDKVLDKIQNKKSTKKIIFEKNNFNSNKRDFVNKGKFPQLNLKMIKYDLANNLNNKQKERINFTTDIYKNINNSAMKNSLNKSSNKRKDEYYFDKSLISSIRQNFNNTYSENSSLRELKEINTVLEFKNKKLLKLLKRNHKNKDKISFENSDNFKFTNDYLHNEFYNYKTFDFNKINTKIFKNYDILLNRKNLNLSEKETDCLENNITLNTEFGKYYNTYNNKFLSNLIEKNQTNNNVSFNISNLLEYKYNNIDNFFRLNKVNASIDSENTNKLVSQIVKKNFLIEKANDFFFISDNSSFNSTTKNNSDETTKISESIYLDNITNKNTKKFKTFKETNSNFDIIRIKTEDSQNLSKLHRMNKEVKVKDILLKNSYNKNLMKNIKIIKKKSNSKKEKKKLGKLKNLEEVLYNPKDTNLEKTKESGSGNIFSGFFDFLKCKNYNS